MRVTRRAILLGAVGLATEPAARAGQARAQPLFVVARSKNANVVHYEARLCASGRLDPEEPLVAYWIMHAENGRREDLTWLERRLAYGFESSLESGGEALRVRLRAFTRRVLHVRRGASGYRAEVPIGERPAVLERIFVCTDEGGMTPSVRYLELSGFALRDGARLHERIVP